MQACSDSNGILWGPKTEAFSEGQQAGKHRFSQHFALGHVANFLPLDFRKEMSNRGSIQIPCDVSSSDVSNVLSSACQGLAELLQRRRYAAVTLELFR